MIRHAGLVALRLGGYWRGALIEGPSGVGKSDLALRALEIGFQLTADDRTLTFTSGGVLYGRAPESLFGLIEMRGLGVSPVRALSFARIELLVRCVTAPMDVERMPDARAETVLGVEVPLLELWPLEPAAPAKMRRALEALGGRAQQAYQASLAPPRRRLGA